MESIQTKYGVLNGISSVEFYPDGSLKECILSALNRLATPYGELIPQYETDGIRRKYVKSLSFHQNGNLKSISFQKATIISTPLGAFPAELVIFYPGGEIKRLFPLNGKLSGFWSEEDEYQLAQEIEFSFSFGFFKQKVIGRVC